MKIRIRYSKWLVPKGYAAITIYPFIFLRQVYPTHRDTLKHELIHIQQVQRDGWLVFYVYYIWQFFYRFIKYRSRNASYLRISYEVEAYRRQKEKFNRDEMEMLQYNKLKIFEDRVEWP